MYPDNSTSLTSEQRRFVVLLAVGTFLEYFDLMLYLHMAPTLNTLFFPPTEASSAALLDSFTYAIPFVIRPLGAIVFGYIADRMGGRRSTVIITTLLMAFTSFTMAFLPTFKTIGVAASVAMLACRMMQSVSSMGEIIGAELYLTESLPGKKAYAPVTLVSAFSTMGGTAALIVGVICLASNEKYGWRAAFLFGSLIAVVGATARSALRETPDFLDAKKRLKRLSQTTGNHLRGDHPGVKERISMKQAIAILCIHTGWAPCFTFAFNTCPQLLKQQLGYTAQQVASHNIPLTVINAINMFVLVFLSTRVSPLKLLKARFYIFFPLLFCIPFVVQYYLTPGSVLLMQILVLVFGLNEMPAVPIFLKVFPVLLRFSVYGLMWSVGRAVMYIYTSMGWDLLQRYLAPIGINFWGYWILLLPSAIAFLWAVNYFDQIEEQKQKEEFLRYQDEQALASAGK